MLNRLHVLAAIFFAFYVSNSEAWLIGLLGRSAVSRGVVSGTARTSAAEATGARLSMGRANSAAASARDFSWVEREIAKTAIKQAFEGKYQGTSDLSEASCLAIEFDGHGNYLANYCNDRVEIAGFVQQNILDGSIVTLGCRDCAIQPGELLFFAPISVKGPFVAAQYRRSTTVLEGQTFLDSRDLAPQQRAIAQVNLDASILKYTLNGEDASAILEVRNQSPISVGLVVSTRSIWSIAQATIYNECGGTHEHWNLPYDAFTGISKEPSSPTWIAPQGKIVVVVKGNTRRGNLCKLSHVTIDTHAYRPGQSQGQPTPIFASVSQ